MKQAREKPKNPPNLYKRGNSWIVDFYYRGLRHRENIGPVSRTQAKEKRDQLKGDMAAGRLDLRPKTKDWLFADALKRYLEYYRDTVRPKTHTTACHNAKRLRAFFGNRRLSAVSAFLIEKYRRERKSDGAAEATINNELALLRSFLNKCVEWKFLHERPEVKAYKLDNARNRYLTSDELDRLLVASNDDLKIVILTAVYTGLRYSELKSLTWRNINFVIRSVTVESAYAKNHETRTIPLNDTLTEALRHLNDREQPNPNDSVFTRGGKPWKSWRPAFENALKRADIQDFKFHDCRHTFGSYLGMAGVTQKAIMELMGHKDPKMSLRYTHLSLDHMRAAVTKIEQIGSGVTAFFTAEGAATGTAAT